MADGRTQIGVEERCVFLFRFLLDRETFLAGRRRADGCGVSVADTAGWDRGAVGGDFGLGHGMAGMELPATCQVPCPPPPKMGQGALGGSMQSNATDWSAFLS